MGNDRPPHEVKGISLYNCVSVGRNFTSKFIVGHSTGWKISTLLPVRFKPVPTYFSKNAKFFKSLPNPNQHMHWMLRFMDTQQLNSCTHSCNLPKDIFAVHTRALCGGEHGQAVWLCGRAADWALLGLGSKLGCEDLSFFLLFRRRNSWCCGQ